MLVSLAALVAGAGIAACGGSRQTVPPAPSALDPASHVPAAVIAYTAVTVRPQGAFRVQLVHAIDALAGPNADRTLVAKLESSLRGDWPALKGWIGQRVGFALTAWPASPRNHQELLDDLVVVAPTNNPSAAARFLSTKLKGPNQAGKVVGDYAVFGGPNAVGQALAASPGHSLAATGGFRTAMKALGGSQLVSAYTPLHHALAAILPTLVASGAPLPTTQLQSLMAKIPAGSTAAYGLAATSNGMRMDIVTHGLQTTTTTTGSSALSSLPGGSWLALTLGGALARSGDHAVQLAAAIQRLQTLINAHAGPTARQSVPLRFVEQDLLPALGPMSLAVGGSSLATLQASLILTPLDRAAGARLVSGVRRLAPALPILAASSAGRAIVAFGYSSLHQLLAPRTTLASDPGFRRAVAQLPAGSRPGLFINFAPLAQLAALGHSPQAAAAAHALTRLGYLIAGGTSTHFRLVLTAR